MDALVIGLVTGLLAFLGSLLGHWIARKRDVALDVWRRREESLRMLRWAVELAIDDSAPSRQEAGIDILDALYASPLLQDDDVALVESVMSSIALSNPVDAEYSDVREAEER